jgi:hypothetical protein
LPLPGKKERIAARVFPLLKRLKGGALRSVRRGRFQLAEQRLKYGAKLIDILELQQYN